MVSPATISDTSGLTSAPSTPSFAPTLPAPVPDANAETYEDVYAPEAEAPVADAPAPAAPEPPKWDSPDNPYFKQAQEQQDRLQRLEQAQTQQQQAQSYQQQQQMARQRAEYDQITNAKLRDIGSRIQQAQTKLAEFGVEGVDLGIDGEFVTDYQAGRVVRSPHFQQELAEYQRSVEGLRAQAGYLAAQQAAVQHILQHYPAPAWIKDELEHLMQYTDPRSMEQMAQFRGGQRREKLRTNLAPNQRVEGTAGGGGASGYTYEALSHKDYDTMTSQEQAAYDKMFYQRRNGAG